MKKVAIVMGSDSDLPIVEKAAGKLAEYAVPFEVHVFSAHRTPDAARQFACTAREHGRPPGRGHRGQYHPAGDRHTLKIESLRRR